MLGTLLLLLMAILPLADAQEGTATLSLDRWDRLLAEAEAAAQAPAAPYPVLQVDRSLEGSVQRGVFTGTLITRVRVPAAAVGLGEELRVPLLDSSASIASVQLNGRTTSLLPVGDRYTVAVDGPGDHVIRVDFFLGRPDDRFARRLLVSLPPAGPTRLSVRVPEADISAELSQGAVTALREDAGGTLILGQLDGRGSLDLSWKGRTRGEVLPVKAEARVHALFTLHEALVRGVVQVQTTVLEGETDRLSLSLPAGVEVVDVQGDAVLQWRTEGEELVVLLRYLVDDSASVQVFFQLPVELDQPVTLRMPLPKGEVPTSGALGVQGPAGLEATVRSTVGTTALQDLPPELAALTPNPLLLGFTFAEIASAPPSVEIDVRRQAEVELTSTQIDSLEASTVMLQDGAQVSRLQLHVRNETRQYLGVRLPEGAVLTHARLDGRALRPATSTDGSTLLLPLIQSERLEEGEVQTWLVQEGDTLSDLADRFYGDPGQWATLIDANPDTLGPYGLLEPGQLLVVPPDASGAAPMSRFAIDLAWTIPGEAMGLIGRRSLRLPQLDAGVVEATWHVYLPHAVTGLSFGGNLSPWSHLRYDHFRRVRQFLDLAFGEMDAWAGYDSSSEGYENILSRRKQIYVAEQAQAVGGQEVSSSFPLVGERHRFRRSLMGEEVPELTVTWLSRSLLPPLRWLVLLVATGLCLGFLSTEERGRRVGVGLGFLGLFVLAWYVMGLHRRILWGIDLGLMLYLGRSLLPDVRRWWTDPPSLAELLDGWTPGRVARGFGVALAIFGLLLVPLLWSTLALVGLTIRLRRSA